MKALLHYRASLDFVTLLRDMAPAGVETAIVEESDWASFDREIGDTDILLHALEPITAAMIAAAPRLKLIQKIGVGVNTIDLDAARARGIAVANMPGTNTAAVAEMTLTLMLAALRRVTYCDPLTRGGDGWAPDLAAIDGMGEIAGRTIGLVGFGAVPQYLAPILRAMGAEVIFSNRTERASPHARQVPLSDLLASADIVSLHVPLTDDTARMIDADALSRMKPGALLINTARGGLVDEPALVAALSEGRLGAAGLDVFASEPVDPRNPLLAMTNVVAMPHIAWLTPETLRRSLVVAFENVRRLMDGRELIHRVA